MLQGESRVWKLSGRKGRWSMQSDCSLQQVWQVCSYVCRGGFGLLDRLVPPLAVLAGPKKDKLKQSTFGSVSVLPGRCPEQTILYISCTRQNFEAVGRFQGPFQSWFMFVPSDLPERRVSAGEDAHFGGFSLSLFHSLGCCLLDFCSAAGAADCLGEECRPADLWGTVPGEGGMLSFGS